MPPSRRSLCSILSLLLLLSSSLFFLSFRGDSNATTTTTKPQLDVSTGNSSVDASVDPLHPYASLIGPPTRRFRDNLRADKKYISSWISAGWTNDVMTYINLIYLGIITERIPILPMFHPSHIGGHVPPIPFSEVFDVPRLRRLLKRPILEWGEVKQLPIHPEDDYEELGCWNVWEGIQYNEHSPRQSPVPAHLNLDISYTRLPIEIKLIPNYEHDKFTTFWALAPYAYPETREASLVTPLASPHHNVALPPDEHMLCYDYLYYVCASQSNEFEYDYSPAWNFAGQYMRWTERLERLGDTYVRRAMGIDDAVTPTELPTPPYISIHVRHNDFLDWCGTIPVDDCFASIEIIARRVREVQLELYERHGIRASSVVMTSDERDADWWEAVHSLGWLRIDHSRTEEQYGPWYPVLVDAVIQSGGAGFVGTDRSTMSILARRRVQSWRPNGSGVARVVKWGYPGADDH